MKQYIFLTLCILLLGSSSAFAQMFSVGGADREYFNPYAPYARAGIKVIDFTYEGDDSAILPNNRLDVSTTAFYAGFETMGFELGATLANDLTGLEDESFFKLHLQFSNPFMIVREKNFSAGIPINLETNLTVVRNDNTTEEFSQTDFRAGAGAIIQIRAGRTFSWTNEFTPAYGFSNSSGGFFGGSVFALSGKSRLNFYNVAFGKNLSLGFDYNSNSYDIDGEEFDYDLKSLTFTLGISL